MASLRFWRRDDTSRPVRPDLNLRTADLSNFIGPTSPWATYTETSWVGAVDPQRAIESTIALYSCVALLAETIGSLPLHLYQRGPQGREKVDYTQAAQNMAGRGYPGSLAKLIGLLPNDELVAQELWSNVVGHCALWGNAYVQVIRDYAGRPSTLWLLRPDRMRVDRDEEGKLRYNYSKDNTYSHVQPADERIIPEVMHIRAFGTDGVMGISPLRVARTRLATDRAQQTYGAGWYKSGATPSAVVTMPPVPNDKYRESVKLFRDDLNAHYAGPTNAGKIAVVQNGSDWRTLSMPMQDMQFIETMHFAVEDWARLYRIPAFMIGQTQRGEASYNSVEQRNLHFLTYSLRPILARLEAAVSRDLGLVPGYKTLEDEGLYAEFVTADLLRTDLITRYQAYQIGIQARFLSPAQVATIENLPYDPTRPSEFENPNTKPEAPAQETPPPDPGMMQQKEADLALTKAMAARMAEPLPVPQLPNIEIQPAAPPPVHIYNKDVAGEMREAIETIPTPTVVNDLSPVAKMVGEVAARQILATEDAERRAEQRHAEMLEAMKPPPPAKMVRKVERDAKTGLITQVVEVPEEEAG